MPNNARPSVPATWLTSSRVSAWLRCVRYSEITGTILHSMENIVGVRGGGLKIALQTLTYGRVGIAASGIALIWTG